MALSTNHDSNSLEHRCAMLDLKTASSETDVLLIEAFKSLLKRCKHEEHQKFIKGTLPTEQIENRRGPVNELRMSFLPSLRQQLSDLRTVALGPRQAPKENDHHCGVLKAYRTRNLWEKVDGLLRHNLRRLYKFYIGFLRCRDRPGPGSQVSNTSKQMKKMIEATNLSLAVIDSITECSGISDFCHLQDGWQETVDKLGQEGCDLIDVERLGNGPSSTPEDEPARDNSISSHTEDDWSVTTSSSGYEDSQSPSSACDYEEFGYESSITSEKNRSDDEAASEDDRSGTDRSGDEATSEDEAANHSASSDQQPENDPVEIGSPFIANDIYRQSVIQLIQSTIPLIKLVEYF
ncbi:hypothetical protein MJO28_001331 [Puccinia striiformis f. sp. tritici]|uniref:Uncharacterized protein n=2 Tax=Puccinia striiformis TaxID=27350 RepID=A0A2S4UUQ0_9BASI|nr:hypothetical protein MJO28_001331 [Puccinia striiformis f. sp. tritici]POW01018.1 hypothetical protein PSHT_12759 [Puccinia striiformis]